MQESLQDFRKIGLADVLKTALGIVAKSLIYPGTIFLATFVKYKTANGRIMLDRCKLPNYHL